MPREGLRKSVDWQIHKPVIRFLNSNANKQAVVFLLSCEAILCSLILWRVPCEPLLGPLTEGRQKKDDENEPS